MDCTLIVVTSSCSSLNIYIQTSVFCLAIHIFCPFLFSVPEGVPAPTLSNGVPGQVVVTWEPPDQPNGEILYYLVERAQGDEDYNLLFNATADSVLLFGDVSVEPFTEYKYRIVAVNSAGSANGPASTITTPEAGQYHNIHMICELLLNVPLYCLQLQRECSLLFSLLSHLLLLKFPFSNQELPMEKLFPTR